MSTARRFFLRDEGFEESDNLSEPGVLAQAIVVDLESAFEQFREGSFAPPCLHYSSRCFVLYNLPSSALIFAQRVGQHPLS